MARKPKEGQIAQTGNIDVINMFPNKIQYNPSKISLPTYEEMRWYPTSHAALKLIKLPIMAVDWYIKCDDELIAKELEEDLRPIFPELIRDMTLAFDFGNAPFEKIFEINKRVKYKKLLSLSPFIWKPRVDKMGNFDGIENVSSTEAKPIKIDAEDCFVFTHQKEFGNNHGIPRLRGSYTPWFICRYVLQYAATYFEKYAGPLMLGYAPQGKTKFKGEEIDNIDMMVKILKSLQSSSVAALPMTGTKKDERKYWIEILESARTGGNYTEFLRYMDHLIFMGIACPELAYSSGEKGSYALGEEQFLIFFQGIDGELLDMSTYIDKYIINDLVSWNYGEKYKGKVHWIYQPLSKTDKKLVKDILLALVQQGNVDVARDFLRESSGLPLVKKYLGDEKNIKLPEKTIPKEATNASRVAFTRKPNKIESHVNFEKIKDRFDKNEAGLIAATAVILSKQKDNLLNNIKKALTGGGAKQLKNVDIAYRSEYENTIANTAEKIFEEGIEDVVDEMDLKDIQLPPEAKAWVNARAKNIAEKHLNDLKFAVVGSALIGISKELSEKDILYQAEQKFNKYVDESLNDSSIMLTHKFYSEGREWTADESGMKYAEWSAVLDKNTCEYCEGRDGQIIELSNPDFSEFSPGNVHENCRCIWIYLEETEGLEPNWRTPAKKDVAEYYMARR